MAPLREGWSWWVWRKRTCTSLEAPAPQCPELGPLRGPQDINPLLSSLRPGQIGGRRFCCPRGKWGWIGAGQLSLPGAHHLDLHPPLLHPAPPSWAAGQASLTPTARVRWREAGPLAQHGLLCADWSTDHFPWACCRRRGRAGREGSAPVSGDRKRRERPGLSQRGP